MMGQTVVPFATSTVSLIRRGHEKFLASDRSADGTAAPRSLVETRIYRFVYYASSDHSIVEVRDASEAV
jgi:hypothetical protein